MARLFKDGAGTTYDGTAAKFKNNPFTTYSPYDYGTTYGDASFPTSAALLPGLTAQQLFKARVDNSMAGSMRDCAECHVGGGANEYVPGKSPEVRTSLRDYLFGSAVTAFNYFIDVYGSRGDGFNTDGTPASYAAVQNDYSQTGVLEMDCLMCHLKDYSWAERKKAVRTGKFDASRTTGALLGAASPTDGVNVTYDPLKVVPTGDNSALKLAGTVAGNILATPDSNNCVGCHMAEHAVDWKKRGDSWTSTAEVHYSMGCMGCHKRKDADFSKAGTSGFSGLKGTYGFNNISSASPGDDSKKLGQCDPAKGNGAYESLWNATDNTTKNCSGCHIYGGDFDPATQSVIAYDTLGAPNPTAAHQAKGLTAKIVQQGGTMNGTANVGHTDLIACEACHARKLGNFTGGAMVDGTGNDAEGRLADHENENVTRQNMTNNNFMAWQGNRLTAANLSTSLFWRDKNDVNFDANNDGRAGGMDSLLQTHVANINKANTYTSRPGQQLVALTQLSTVTAADISDHINAIDRDLEYQLGLKANPGSTGDNTKTHVTKLSFMGVTFKTNHDISPADSAWGSGGCGDCHKGSTSAVTAGTIGDTTAGGFYNGKFVVKGDTLNMSWTGGGAQVTPFASVNASTQPSDFHPGVKERSGVRSLAVQFASNAITIRDIDRSEGLYENAFKARNTAFNTSISGAAITFPAATSTTTTSQGWLLKIEATNNAGVTVVARTKQVSALVTDMTGLLANLGAAFSGTWDGTSYSGGQPEFGIRANGSGLLIEGRNGYSVRIHPQSDAGPLGLAGSLWIDKQYKGITTDQTGAAVATSDRKAWVAYLNSFADPAQQAKTGFGVDPVAQFPASFPDADPNTAGYQLVVNTPYTLAADTGGNTNGFFTYSLSFTDGTTAGGPSVSKTFSTLGTYSVTLKVTDEEGKTATVSRALNVVNPPVVGGMTIGPTTAKRGVSTSYTFGNLKDHDTLRIIWADGTSTTLPHVGAAGSSATISHVYATTGTKKLTVLVYKNGVLVDSKYNYVTVTL